MDEQAPVALQKLGNEWKLNQCYENKIKIAIKKIFFKKIGHKLHINRCYLENISRVRSQNHYITIRYFRESTSIHSNQDISFKTSKLKTREKNAMISPLPGRENTISVDYS